MTERIETPQSHQWVEERLSEYIDNRLDPLERAHLERHLQACGRCANSLESMRWTILLLKRAPAPALPRSFVLPVPEHAARAPLLSLNLLRLATALATLILISLVGIDVIFRLGGAAPAPMGASTARGQFPEPTRAALAMPSPTGQAESQQAPAGVAATVALPASPMTPTSMPPSQTPAPSAASAQVAPIAPPVPTSTAQPTILPPRSFSQPPPATRDAFVSPSPSATVPPVGAFGLPPTLQSKANDSANSFPAATSTTAAAAAIEPTHTVVPTPTMTPRVEAFARPTLQPVAPPPTPLEPAEEFFSPLRIAEFAALFATIFLGTLLLFLRRVR